MKKCMVMFLMMTIACTSFAADVELFQYSNRGNDTEQGLSVYNFETKTRGDGENYSKHVMYNGTSTKDAYFEGQMVTDQFSTIVDLGKMSCNSIVSKYPEYKHSIPTSWLLFAHNKEINNEDLARLDVRMDDHRFVRAPAIKGHCYFLHFNDSDSQVMGLFHVKEITNSSAIIDEMETLLIRKI